MALQDLAETYSSRPFGPLTSRPTPHKRQQIDFEADALYDALRQVVAFTTTDHLGHEIVRDFWRGDPRAETKLRVVARLLGHDVVDLLRWIRQSLDECGGAPVGEGVEAVLDAVVALRPYVEHHSLRHALDALQYAVELQSAVMRLVLDAWQTSWPSGARPADRLTPVELLDMAQLAVNDILEQQEAWQRAVADYLASLQQRFHLLDEAARQAGMGSGLRWEARFDAATGAVDRVMQRRQQALRQMAVGGGEGVVRPPVAVAARARSARLPSPVQRLKHSRTLVTGAILLGSLGVGLPSLANAQPTSTSRTASPAVGEAASQQLSQRVQSYFDRMQATPSQSIDRLQIGSVAALNEVISNLSRLGYDRGELRDHFSYFRGSTTVELRWSADGRPLLIPQVATQPTTQLDSGLTVVGRAKALGTVLPYTVQPNDSVAQIAKSLGVSVDDLIAHNNISDNTLLAGTVIELRLPATAKTEAALRHVVARRSTLGATTNGADSPHVSSAGAIVVAASPSAGTGDALSQRYGAQLFSSLETMPDEVNGYVTSTVQEVADFFDVRPGDILGILRAENNNAGYRIAQPSVSSVGAAGVAQVVPQTWNGWRNPQASQHSRDMRSIQQYGGIGFDWSLRNEWRAWQEGRSNGDALANSNADPNRFENGVAAIARFLSSMGLTREAAATDPSGFRSRLQDGIAIYNSGKPLSESGSWVQSSANRKTVAQYVADALAVSDSTPLTLVGAANVVVDGEALVQAYAARMDQMWGMASSEAVMSRVRSSEVAQRVTTGQLSVDEGAAALVATFEARWLQEGQQAQAVGTPLPWPFVYDESSLQAQRLAVRHTGNPLPHTEMQALLKQSKGDVSVMERALAGRVDARLFSEAVQRRAALLPDAEPSVSATNAMLRPILDELNGQPLDEPALQAVLYKVDASLTSQAAAAQPPVTQSAPPQATHRFAATPLLPMPPTFKGFGVHVDYQAGGSHTGIDVANPRENGQEPPIYAVGDGEVVHVGPLYCDVANACRGGKAIILHHGNNLYSIYSHNSQATVVLGQRVAAGEMIGRQGNEGYSFGAHLHFEIHSGSPYSGNWQEPWTGGQFEDPADWLPN
ncbi:MAG: LysM peptidoglycan-binding domain-containing M23 family metallopeptidase [Ardenticatenales bacterium]|nr:LysM peptidoglycan-binding domain-containing M23 family metallopeptidase [Ardenticatenales bacterium]